MGVRLVVGHDRLMVPMTDLLVLSLLIGAASYRVWRLLAHDRILNPLRAKVPEGGRLEYWLGCPWCSPAYYNAALVAVWAYYNPEFGIGSALLVYGAATVVTGVLGDRL